MSRRSFQNLSGDYAIRDEALPVDGSAVVDDQSTTYALLKIGGDARRHGLVLQETLGWAPVRAPAAAEFADADSLMEPCELIYIFPRLVNNTNDDWWGETDSVAPPGSDPAYPTKVPNWATVSKWKRGLDILDIEVELKSISGAQQIMEFQENLKVLPWLSPGEDTQVLVRDSQSRFYREQQDARFETFSGSLSTSTVAVYASKLGWLIKAPANTGASATTIAAQFQVRFQAYNLDKIIPGAGGLFFDGTFDGDGKENAYSTFTQYIDVDGEDDGGTSFCQ